MPAAPPPGRPDLSEGPDGEVEQPQVGQLPVALVQVEAVADEELVGDDEADVAHRQVVDEPPVGPVEQRDGGDRRGLAQLERPPQVVEREPGVDHVLDDEDVAVADVEVEVFEDADLVVTAHPRAAVAGKLDEVEAVHDRKRAREVGEEDEARLQRADEQRLEALVVVRDLGTQLVDAGGDLDGGEVDLADARIAADAVSSRGRDGNAARGARGRAGRRA
jgi:hypothetical protein